MGILSFAKRQKQSLHGEEDFAVLDIGSHKVSCLIARWKDNRTLIKGWGYQASKGIRAGQITDMEALSQTIASVLNMAEKQADGIVKRAFISTPMGRSLRTNLSLNITGHPVDEEDMKKLQDVSPRTSQDQRLHPIHTFPLGYTIDDQKGIHDPRGFLGDRLHATLHNVYLPLNQMRNFSHCLSKCHVQDFTFISSAYAGGLACLADSEVELGCILIDIGSAMTNIGVFTKGKFVYGKGFPIGGTHITNDIAHVFSTKLNEAERLKTLYGGIILTPQDDRETLKIKNVMDISDPQGTLRTRGDLIRIITPRLEEIFDIIKQDLDTHLKNVNISRAVLTGGSSQMTDLRDFTAKHLNLQTRIGLPLNFPTLPDFLNTSSFATAIGLLRYAEDHMGETHQTQTTKNKGLFSKMNTWVRDNL